MIKVVERNLSECEKDSKDYNQERNKSLQNFYHLWLCNKLPPEVTFKTLLTYEKFKDTNVQLVVLTGLQKKTQATSTPKAVLERTLRNYYNEIIVNATQLPKDIVFLNGTTADDYLLPTSKDIVPVNVEFSEEEERLFMDEVIIFDFI